MNARQASGTVVVDAPAERIFALLTDPARHPLIDGSGSVQSVQPSGPQRLTLDAPRPSTGPPPGSRCAGLGV
jgi:uncharacterized protein YndB with AHSA1/START domain